MAEYKYGVYGSLGTDIVQSASQASVVPEIGRAHV